MNRPQLACVPSIVPCLSRFPRTISSNFVVCLFLLKAEPLFRYSSVLIVCSLSDYNEGTDGPMLDQGKYYLILHKHSLGRHFLHGHIIVAHTQQFLFLGLSSVVCLCRAFCQFSQTFAHDSLPSSAPLMARNKSKRPAK